MPKLEIGASFDYDWETEGEDGYEYFDEVVTVHGYVYYEESLYYVCLGETDQHVDVHYVVAENRVANA